MLGEVETSESGAKRQFARCKAMSGIGGKADLPVERANFSLWPEADFVIRDNQSHGA